MGFSSSEKEGCRQILHQLNSSDLVSLYETVLKAKTTIRDRTELIEKIIAQSNSATELLNRKKVYRDIIVQYLNNERIFMYAKSTKQKAIQTSLEHWSKTGISLTVESKAEKKACSLQIQNTTSHTDLGQLAIKFKSLSINSDEVGQAESSITGAKPKVKTTSNTSSATSVTFTVSLALVSEEKTHRRTKKH